MAHLQPLHNRSPWKLSGSEIDKKKTKRKSCLPLQLKIIAAFVKFSEKSWKEKGFPSLPNFQKMIRGAQIFWKEGLMLLHLLPVRILVRSLSLTPHPRLDHQLLVYSASKFLIIEKSPKSQRLIFCNHASESCFWIFSISNSLFIFIFFCFLLLIFYYFSNASRSNV